MHHVGPFGLNRARLRAHGAMDARNDVSITDCFELGVRPDVSFVLVNLTGEDRTRKMKSRTAFDRLLRSCNARATGAC
jgi:hypothetical protein